MMKWMPRANAPATSEYRNDSRSSTVVNHCRQQTSMPFLIIRKSQTDVDLSPAARLAIPTLANLPLSQQTIKN